MVHPSLFLTLKHILQLKLKLKPSFLLTFPFSSTCNRHHYQPFTLPLQRPPVAKKLPFTSSAHGRTWQDPYHWMRNTKDPDFVEYLHLENSYSQAFMEDTQKLQRILVEEMRGRIPTTVSTPPERWGPWLYHQYIPKGKEYPVLCRRLETEKSGWAKKLFGYASGQSGREQILLDWNEIAEKYGYVHVGTCRVSPHHNFLAYTLDITGNERFMLQIKNLKNGSLVSRSLVDGVVSLAWAQDGCTLFYTLSDENQRPHRVLCTNLRSNEANDVPIFTESDSSFCVDIMNTKDGRFITVNSNSRTSSEEEVYVIDTTKPLDSLRKVHKRVSGVQCFLEHHHGLFYVLTNAPLREEKEWSVGDYYLARCPVEHVELSDWQDILLPSKDMSFHDMDIFNGHLVLFTNKKGSPTLCSIDLPIKGNFQGFMDIENLDPWFFPQPSGLCSIVPGSNHDFMNSVYRVVLSSPVVPDVIIDYDLSKRTFSVVLQEEVSGVSGYPGSCSPLDDVDVIENLDKVDGKDKHERNSGSERWKDWSNAYCCERKEVLSQDGVKVPVTIMYSQKAWQKGLSPGLLQGYGAYGEVLDKSWSSDRLSLLDRGWVLAFADVRGGGGVDSSWHKSGSGLNKHNSINDFVSCGKYLVSEGYVHGGQLGAIGVSAGGLLVAAALNMYPDLFSAAILKVPFLDTCNTLLDPSLPLTTLDYDEFGNPQILSNFEYILSYSPYDNIRSEGCHPSILVTASFHDSRVGIWEAAKWVARLRDCTCASCSRSVILRTNMAGGHFGEGGRYIQSEETAYEYAFLLKVMGFAQSKE